MSEQRQFGSISPWPSPARSAMIAAGLYAFVGILWIVGSDWILLRLTPGPEAFATLQTWKGGLFVGVTSVILFLILRTQFSRRAREAARLREASERVRSHVENTPLAVIEWDEDFRVVRWSERAEELFGWSESELLGRSWGDWRFIVPEDQQEVDELIASSLAEGASGSMSVNRNYRKDGSLVWCEWYNSWIRDSDGNAASMMSLAHDVTAERGALEEIRRLNRQLESRVHRRTEELAQANADLRGLTYSISHDLRAPVRAVLGFGEILERRHREAMPDEARGQLDHILEAGRQMDRLIDGLLEYGRIESGSLDLEPVDPAPIVREVVEEIEAATGDALGRVELSTELPTVRADRQALRRILQNLIGNSHKYRSPDRPLRIDISGRREAGRTQLRVADNGPGIPVEHRARVFELFERLHPQERVPGSGLGLAVVKRSMELMGGTVRIVDGDGTGKDGSPESEGAIFVLTFQDEPVPSEEETE